MSIRIVVYGSKGDGTAYSAMAQIRSLVNEMHADISVDLVTDEHMRRMNGVDQTPSIYVDGVMISTGYAPSRMQMRRAIQLRLDSLHPRKSGTS